MAARKKAPAKRGASRYQAPPKQPVPGWIWLACGLLLGGFVVLLLQLQPGGEDIRRQKAEAKRPATKQTTPAAPKQAPAKPKYDFYTLLPDSQVIVPPNAMPAEPVATPAPVSAEEAARIDAARAEALLNGTTPPPAAVVAKAPSSPQLFLQAGSFRKLEDADKLRAQILLLGQAVQTEPGTVRGETWHRVLVGPFSNREQLAQAQKSLASSGFSNLLLQQR